MNHLLKFAFLGLLCSCQTLDMAEMKGACDSLDWFEIGRSQGVLGRNSLGWKETESQCTQFDESHHESYVNGWYAGINQFCSGDHGFAYGKSGQAYNNVCPSGKEKAFMHSYKQGTQVFKIETANRTLREEIQRLRGQREPAEAATSQKKIEELNQQMKKNRAQIRQINRRMSRNSKSSPQDRRSTR